MAEIEKGQQINFQSSLTVLGLLGEGAFGKVFLVEKQSLNGLLPRKYALKIFHSMAATDVLCAEAEATFRVRSRHCVRVHSIEEFEGGRGLLMEYIEGATLEDLARQFDLSAEEQQNIVSQILQGLNDLHTQSQVHGDLSPKNIMVDREGRVILLDFGLTSVFAPGCVVGSPAYLSARRLEGQEASVEDDHFALALIDLDLKQGDLGRSAPFVFWEQRKARAKKKLVLAGSDPLPSVQSKVRQLLKQRDSHQHTIAIGRPFGMKVNSRYFRAMNTLFLVFLVAAVPPSHRMPVYGWLSVRSLKWIKLSFPGGFLLHSNSGSEKIPSGIHDVHWQTARKNGRKTIQIRENERLVLTEGDFN